MKEFIVRLFSLLAIVGVLFGYNEVLDVRAKDEEIAKLNAQLEVQSFGAGSDSESGSDSGDGAGYKDGTYTGEADGFGGCGRSYCKRWEDRSGRSDFRREGRQCISCNGGRYHSKDHRDAECRS